MGRVIQFPGNPSTGFGFKKVNSRKKIAEKQEQLGQLNIFSNAKKGKVIQMPEGGSFFEEAVRLDESDSDSAIVAYEKSIDMEQNKADSYCNLGVLEYNNGNESKSMSCFTKALGLDPRHIEAHFNLANLYSEKGNGDLAIFHYEAAINIDPTFADGFYNLGLVLISQKQFSKALDILSAYKVMSHGQDNEVGVLIENLKMTLDTLSS